MSKTNSTPSRSYLTSNSPDLSDQQFQQVLVCLNEIKECVENATNSEIIKTWQLLCNDFSDDIHLIQQVHNIYKDRLVEALQNGVKPYSGEQFIGADPKNVKCFRLGNVRWMIIEESLNTICNIQKEAACITTQK